MAKLKSGTRIYGDVKIDGGIYDSSNKIGIGGSVLISTGVGIAWTSSAGGGSITISDDTSTNATRYILFDDITSGSATSVNVSSTKLTYNPSSGTLSVDGAVEIGATDSGTQKFSINFNETTDSLDFDYTA